MLYKYSKLHPSPKLERPIPSYTSQELETLVQKSYNLETNWTKERSIPTRIREIQTDEGTPTFLLPGGRWLVVVGRDQSVIYFDLNESDPIKKTLLPAVDMTTIFDIAIDAEMEELSPCFKLAVLTESPGELIR